ncbi:MAG TPA: sulfatase-like hydrolase/transferase [Alphaproteobacteria bacterium]
MKTYLKSLLPYLYVFLALQSFVRLTLMVRSIWEVGLSTSEAVQILLRGLWFDAVVASFILLPVAFACIFIPRGHKAENTLRFIFLYVLLFTGLAEHFFWTEFSTRFNFIAVDYLVYTTEVIGNIVESYPLPALLTAIALTAALITWVLDRVVSPESATTWRARTMGFVVCVTLSCGFYMAANADQSQFSANTQANELAGNGIYNLFYAFGHNEISYKQFYAMNPHHEVQAATSNLFSEENEELEKIGDSFVRIIRPAGPERHKNVMIVVMESLSAEFMATFGNTENLTPNLDRLSNQGLSFTHAYATGTRTVRGLEAVALSIPPTPGQSIVRRKDNANLFSLGFVFRDRGYDTKFIYGGHGYFDNMNAFFAGNGFDILDRYDFADDEVNFSNVWGVADDDLFAKAIKEADKSYAAGKPFMDVIMTTTNHRPYTYPDGRIDLPSKTAKRSGGVKYADYSIGKLVEWAAPKPWFKDTVFVFVADHTHGAGGRMELAAQKYHIPMIFYAPGFIKPGTFDHIASQIDLGPILLGQLNFHYRSKFYGEDLLHDEDEIPHAFISNYQKVALIREGGITILSPKQGVQQLNWPTGDVDPTPDQKAENDAIAYYQSASNWRETYRRIPTLLSVKAASQ